MTDLLSRMIHMGLGLAAISKDKAEQVVGEWVQRGRLSSAEAGELIDDLVQRGEAARADIGQALQQRIEARLEALNLPTRADIERLEQRIRDLEARLDEKAS